MNLEDKESIEKVLRDTIFNVPANATKKIDSEFSESVELLVQKLARAYLLLNKVINHPANSLTELEIDVNMILWQGTNSLIGTLQLVRQGYFLEPHVLLRHAIEYLSLAIDVNFNVNSYKKFLNGKLSGEECIGRAKQFVNSIGGAYGLLSEIAHPSRNTLGAHFLEKRGTLLIGGGITDEYMHRVKMNIFILNFLLSVYNSSIELVFFSHLPSSNFWRRQGKFLVWSPSVSEKEDFDKSKKLMLEAIKEMG